MNKEQINEIIVSVLHEYLESRGESADVNIQTALVGKKSVIDSIGLVNIIVDIEGRLLDNNIEITLLSEKAMSQKNSPFRNIESLTDFILEEILDSK